MFSKTGIPVRGVIENLTLKETERPSDDRSSAPASQPNPKQDNIASRR